MSGATDLCLCGHPRHEGVCGQLVESHTGANACGCLGCCAGCGHVRHYPGLCGGYVEVETALAQCLCREGIPGVPFDNSVATLNLVPETQLKAVEEERDALKLEVQWLKNQLLTADALRRERDELKGRLEECRSQNAQLVALGLER